LGRRRRKVHPELTGELVQREHKHCRVQQLALNGRTPTVRFRQYCGLNKCQRSHQAALMFAFSAKRNVMPASGVSWSKSRISCRGVSRTRPPSLKRVGGMGNGHKCFDTSPQLDGPNTGAAQFDN
jgi:hypothetical protein